MPRWVLAIQTAVLGMQADVEQCSEAELEARFGAELGLGRLAAAAQTAARLQDSDLWRELAEAAVHVKDVDLAIKYALQHGRAYLRPHKPQAAR